MRRLADDEHGRGLWLHRGCRCSTCHRALLDYATTRRAVLAVVEGREPKVWVDAEPARRHVRQLLAAGWSQRRLARYAGVHSSTIYNLLSGQQNVTIGVDRRLRSVAR